MEMTIAEEMDDRNKRQTTIRIMVGAVGREPDAGSSHRNKQPTNRLKLKAAEPHIPMQWTENSES